MPTMNIWISTLKPGCSPASVRLRWGGNSNNIKFASAHGSIVEIDRLLPGLRYLVKTRANRKTIVDYIKSWENWRDTLIIN